MRETPPPEFRRLLGLVLSVVGTLWLALTGVCSAVFVATVWRGGDPPPPDEAIGMALLIAVPSMVVGGLIYFVGRRLRSSR